jgi:hypothetical protein
VSGISGGRGKRPRYCAGERSWVARLLASLTAAEREEYERRIAAAPGHHNSGKKYDSLKAQIAERVKYEFRRALPTDRARGGR